MKFPFAALAILLALSAPLRAAEPAQLLEKANVLPLALDDAFQFRKTKHFLNDPKATESRKITVRMLIFEQQRINFGAVTGLDRRERLGHYYTFFWKAKRRANITVRLEYRQERLGTYVQAREVSYQGAKGSMRTEFQVIGDDYLEDGRITGWRAVLIEEGKIVGMTQSYLWN